MLFPGLRLGYLVVPAALLARFEQGARVLQQLSAQLLQLTAADFLEQGHFTRHLKKMRQLYAQRRGYLVEALRLHCGAFLRVDEQAGGINLLARLVVDVPDWAVAEAAERAGLGVKALSAWTLEGGQGQGVLMGFTNVASASDAVVVAQVLRAVIAEYLSVPLVTTATVGAGSSERIGRL